MLTPAFLLERLQMYISTVVVSLLTAGCLVNYRSGASQTLVHASNLLSDSRPTKLPTFFGKQVSNSFGLFFDAILPTHIDVPLKSSCGDNQMRIPDTEPFRKNITSRFLAYFPFLMEVWYWLLTYVQVHYVCYTGRRADDARTLSDHVLVTGYIKSLGHVRL